MFGAHLSENKNAQSWAFWGLGVLIVALQIAWTKLFGLEISYWIASPLLPLLLCCAALQKNRLIGLSFVVGVLLLQPILTLFQGGKPSITWSLLMLPCYACYWVAGRLLRRKKENVQRPALENSSLSIGLGSLVCTGFVASVAFYLLSNSFTWALGGSYERSLAGWWQANTVGVPGYPPAFLFLRALLVSQVVFTPTLFFLLHWLGSVDFLEKQTEKIRQA